MSLLARWLRFVFPRASEVRTAPRLPAAAPARAEVEARLSASRVPGAALAAVEDGQVAWTAGYGRIEAGRHAPHVTADTVFQAASLSKPVTALAVLRLVQSGAVGLDDDVRPLLALPLPEHPIIAAQGGAQRAVTVKLLLQHRAGVIGRGTTPADDRGYLDRDRGGGSLRLVQWRGATVPSLEDSWYGRDGGRPVTLTYPPGTQVSYSGAGYLVLQHLVEQLSGRPFRRHLRELLTELGAGSASFELHPPTRENLALGHDETGRPLRGGYELVPWSAAGGLFASAHSMAEILAVMVGRQSPIDPALLTRMADESLGVFGRIEHGERVFRHGGDNAGYRAALEGRPARGAGVVVLTNGRSADGVRLREDLVALAAL